jgi:hypothetical protein
MRTPTYTARLMRSFNLGVLGALSCLPMAAQSALCAEDRSVVSAPARTGGATIVAQAQGMIGSIDPSTGEIRQTPAPGPGLVLSPQELNAASTSHEGLREVPSDRPGGGYRIDLQGRFQSPLMGSVDPAGRARIEHVGPQAEGPGK